MKFTSNEELNTFFETLSFCNSREEVMDACDNVISGGYGHEPIAIKRLFQIETGLENYPADKVDITKSYYGERNIGFIFKKEVVAAGIKISKRVFWYNGFYANTGLSRSWKNEINACGIRDLADFN